jgi:hypothetical protein
MTHSLSSIFIIIKDFDKINNIITFKPFSTFFKKNIEEYEFYNFDIKGYSSEKELQKSLFETSIPIIENIIRIENNEVQDNISNFIENNLNKKIELTKENQEEINSSEVFEIKQNIMPLSGTKINFIL